MGVRIREKPKGSKIFWVFINHKKKRKAKRIGDKKAAELAAVQIRARLALGDSVILDDETKVRPSGAAQDGLPPTARSANSEPAQGRKSTT